LNPRKERKKEKNKIGKKIFSKDKEDAGET